jgi:predicted ATP-grasp superfamily ATP-dependent carboligase
MDKDPGLQAARILAARGVPIVGITFDRSHFACRTNVCDELLVVDEADLVALLVRIGPDFDDRPVLIPCSDPIVRQLAGERSLLEQWYHVPLPPADIVEMLMDKTAFYAYAERQGFPIPRTVVVTGPDDLARAIEQLTFPCVLKPPYRTPRWVENTDKKAIKVDDREALVKLYEECKDWVDELIVQEWIEGGDTDLYSCNCYFDASSKPLVTFIARKIRQWPPGAGDSSLGEECRNDTVLEESIRLFESVGYHGLGYVEMKQDSRTGMHYIVEPNVGRPTGRSAIAEAGGVELLYTMYCDLVGLPLPEARVQTYGTVKWIYLRKDLQSAIRQWRSGDLTPLEWWRSIRGPKVFAIFSLRDPAPFVFDVLNTIKKVSVRAIRRLARR